MANKTKKPLLSDFPPITTEEWMAKITTDLKGADFERKLVWRTNEGFNVQPLYRSEDLKDVYYLDGFPGEFPFIRGTKKNNEWEIRQDIKVKDVVKTNAKVLDILNKGITSINFIIEKEIDDFQSFFKELFKDIEFCAIEINFTTNICKTTFVKEFLEFLNNNCTNVPNIRGSINNDILGRTTKTGKSNKSFDDKFQSTKELIELTKNIPGFKVITIDAKLFNNAGSTIVQELGFGLSIGNEYLAKLTDLDLSVDEVAKAIKFDFAISGNYFMEIAKLRAARLLWATIVKSYNPKCDCSTKIQIHSVTSRWNKTIYDAHVNMLRTQTEAMSACIGGADSITVEPFDTIFKETDDFSERIARNQQLLLKEESHLDKVIDPSAGSYYIENITDSIAREAWRIFVETEEKGGYIQALKEGFVQNIVEESANKKRKAVATRRENLLGTNQFPNFTEVAAKKIEKTNDDNLNNSDNAVEQVKPIVSFRGAQEFEELRLRTENSEKTPKVFMLTYGNLAMRLARSQFSCNFFACAGYEVIDNNGFETVEIGVEAAKKAGADIIVLCSSDDEYAEAAPKTFEVINGEAIFVVAGAPKCADELKEKGITNFINVRSNVLETLKSFSEQLQL